MSFGLWKQKLVSHAIQINLDVEQGLQIIPQKIIEAAVYFLLSTLPIKLSDRGKSTHRKIYSSQIVSIYSSVNNFPF